MWEAVPHQRGPVPGSPAGREPEGGES
jgi:hypothetical protein